MSKKEKLALQLKQASPHALPAIWHSTGQFLSCYTFMCLQLQIQMSCAGLQGRVTPFVDMRIVDGDGKELPRDGKAYGELQVRGPHVIKRYYRVSQRSTISVWAPSRALPQ